MGDPQEFGDPSDYSQRYTGTEDNGGVHTNSGISNHAYYLAVNGGRNASCTANAAHGVLLTGKDCKSRARAGPRQGRADLLRRLHQPAGVRQLLRRPQRHDGRRRQHGEEHRRRQGLGRRRRAHRLRRRGTPPPPPCTSEPNAQLPFASPHPYGNNGDCTWTYDNGSAGFGFHFSLLDTEKDYDYVYVKDAAGTTLATYTGT